MRFQLRLKFWTLYGNTMTRSPLIEALWVLCTVLFLAVQSVTQAHAIEHAGHDHHEHDGVTCELNLVAAEDVVITPPLPFSSPLGLGYPTNWVMRTTSERTTAFDGRAPPPRGPPAH